MFGCRGIETSIITSSRDIGSGYGAEYPHRLAKARTTTGARSVQGGRRSLTFQPVSTKKDSFCAERGEHQIGGRPISMAGRTPFWFMRGVGRSPPTGLIGLIRPMGHGCIRRFLVQLRARLLVRVWPPEDRPAAPRRRRRERRTGHCRARNLRRHTKQTTRAVRSHCRRG